MFDQKVAEKHINGLVRRYKIKVIGYSVSSCGRAWPGSRKIKIPRPTNIDRFCVCLHEVKHIIDGLTGPSFKLEFDCDMYAMDEAKALGFDVSEWEKRTRWHSLSRIAMAMNRKMPARKIPDYIKEYFSDVDFSGWEGRKVFVSSDRKYKDIVITIN